MDTVKVRNTIIGEGMPKICVPIVDNDAESIIREARIITNLPADMVEWRADFYEDLTNADNFADTLKKLREVLGDMPLIVTLRTSEEGGEKVLDDETYAGINIAAVKSGYVDLIDIEAFKDSEIVFAIIEEAHAAGVKVVASNHNFENTPPRDEIIERLIKMQDMGADILKIAVMPTCKQDVLTLLAATEEMKRKYANRPLITISMGSEGVISRMTGEVFGSAVTFGAANGTSAPGQTGVDKLKSMLMLIHSTINKSPISE